MAGVGYGVAFPWLCRRGIVRYWTWTSLSLPGWILIESTMQVIPAAEPT